MSDAKKNKIADMGAIEAIADLSGEVDWTNDELRDAIRQEGIDPDKLVKNVLRGVKELNSNSDKFDLAKKHLEAICGDSSEPVESLGRRLDRTAGNREDPRVEECRKMLVALTPVQYQAVLSILRAFAGQQAVTHSPKKVEEPSLLVDERPSRKFRRD